MTLPEHAACVNDAAVAVAFRDVWKTYPGRGGRVAVNAVEGVSLDVRKGEILCLMGTSGSGKSTLIRHVNRLIEPTHGQVVVLGEDVATLSASALRDWRARRIGMVFQHFALLPHRTVRDNVALALELRGVDARTRRDVAEEHLAAVHLAGWGDHFPHELSGGMQQRVGLARALAADPAVLLMDEPFSALDPTIRRDLQSQFLELAAARNLTTIMVTHDPAEAVRLGSRIAVLRAGRVVQAGTAAELIEQPADDAVAAFFADLREPDAAPPPTPRHVRPVEFAAAPPTEAAPSDARPSEGRPSWATALAFGPAVLAGEGRWAAFWLALLAEGIALAQAGAAIAAFSGGTAGVWGGVLLALRVGTAAWARRRPGRGSAPATTVPDTAALALMTASYALILLRALAGEAAGPLVTFPADRSLAVEAARMIDCAITWTQINLAAYFASLTTGIRTVIESIEAVLGWLPWPVPALALVFVAWRHAGAAMALLAAVGVAYLGLFGFWGKAVATIALVGSSVALCAVIGLPLGILTAKSRLTWAVLSPVLDLMQTLPTFVYLIPAVAFFSVGKTPAAIATVIFALPPMIRLTALGIREVPAHIREAAVAHGASPWQTLVKVELPLAANSLLLGINQTIMMSLAMVVVAALIGAGGLGHDVIGALRNIQAGTGVLAGLAIVFCALVPDRIVQAAARRRALRHGAAP